MRYIFFVVILTIIITIVSTILLRSTTQDYAQKIQRYIAPTETPMYQPIPVDLVGIFQDSHQWVATLEASRKRVLIATGDVLPAREVNIRTTDKNNFVWPYEKTADVLKAADITFVNLETPLIHDCPQVHGGFTFCGVTKNVEGLLYAGVDIVNFANNHAGNYGTEGIEETKNILSENGILVTGIKGPVYKQIGGMQFAFLGYNDIGETPKAISAASEARMKQDITEARAQADIVVVQFHWGVEYTRKPTARQQYLAHLAVDDGADLIIGNHPHWFQSIEVYKDKFIAYSHGNFVFDQEWSIETKQGIVGRYTFYDNILIDVEYLPILIEHYGQPRFMTHDEKVPILEELRDISR